MLVDRDLEKWYKSFDTAIIAALYTWMVFVMTNFLDPYFMTARPATAMRKTLYSTFSCHDRASFQQNARAVYRQHYAKIRALVPKERLLEYRLGSGWEPLCTFLGKRVPNEEFPWKNESKEMEIWMRRTQIRVLKGGFVTAAKVLWMPVLVGAVAYVYMLLK